MTNRKALAILASFLLALGVAAGLRAGEKEGDKGETAEAKKLRGRSTAPNGRRHRRGRNARLAARQAGEVGVLREEGRDDRGVRRSDRAGRGRRLSPDAGRGEGGDGHPQMGDRRSHARVAEEGRFARPRGAAEAARVARPRHGLAVLRARRRPGRPARHALGNPSGHGGRARQVAQKKKGPCPGGRGPSIVSKLRVSSSERLPWTRGSRP